MGDTIVVKGYADLISDRKLRGDDPDVIARELQTHGTTSDRIVARLPDWLVDETDVELVDRSSNVVSGEIEAETEKAVLVVVGRDQAWLPKSQIRIFELADGADISIPQRDIADYATDGGQPVDGDDSAAGSQHASKFFDVGTFRMSGPAREEFEQMRDATLASETVLVVTRDGTAYRVVPREDRDDYIDVWGISDHEHPRTGYARFKALGDAERETAPLRLLGKLALDRVRALGRSLRPDSDSREVDG